MAQVREVSSLEEFQSVVNSGDTVVATFSAPAWCRPCQQFEPHFKKAAEQSEAQFLLIDVDNNAWAMSEFGVQAVPTVMLFSNGEYQKHMQERTVIRLLGEINA